MFPTASTQVPKINNGGHALHLELLARIEDERTGGEDFCVIAS